MTITNTISPHDKFIYDETSPSCLRWKNNVYGGYNYNSLLLVAGTPCGTLNKHNNYWHVQFRGSPKPAHRIIWEMFHNETNVVVIHKNGDKSDNRIENLSARKALDKSAAADHASRKEWSEIFELSEESISGIKWTIDNYTGYLGTVLKAKKGDDVNVSQGKDGYYSISLGINRSATKLHLVIFELYNNKKLDEGNQIDHIDGDVTNNKVTNLREVSRAVNMRNKGKTRANKSGVNGVNSKDKGIKKIYRATWNDLDGKSCEKSFSVNKYGEEEAFRLACEYRAKMIEELNVEGAGYTERHGL